MSEHSQDIIDIKRLKIMPNPKSFTGYSFAALDRESIGLPGLPASPFEVVMYREIERLRNENENMRTFIKKVYDIGNNTDYIYATEAMMDMLKPVASSEDLPMVA